MTALSLRTLLVAAAISVSSVAQSSAGQALTADLVRYYFASPEAEVEARNDLESALLKLQTFKGQVRSGSKLFHELQAYEQVQTIYQRHAGYLHVRCSLNRKDLACDSGQKLESEVNAKTAFIAPQLMALSNRRMQFLERVEPRLRKYRFAIEDIRRDSAHILPEDKESLLDALQPEIADWQYDLYGQILAGTSFGTIQTPSGMLDIVRQRSMLAASPDPHIREEAFKRRYNGYASRRDLLAFALIHTVRAQNLLARTHRYQDAPSRKYLSMYLDPVKTRALLDQMCRQGEFVRRLEMIRSQDYEQAYKTPMKAWDQSAPQRDFDLPITTLTDAPQIFHAAFAGLGAEYQGAFDHLLDPRSGRADVLPGGAPNRYTGGFSIGFPGSTSILFFGRYDGTFKDLSVIAHEGGHATHRALMDANGVSPLFARGSSYLSESFAMFNELVLADYMAEHATDPRLQRYYREQWMSIKGLDAFFGAQDALLEQEIYDGVSAGTILGADDLDRLTEKVDGQFSSFPATTPELHNRWATVSLMYEDPLYDVNYAYGGLLALKYYQLYTTNRDQFIPRYIALLKNGFDAPSAVLLKRFLGIDMSDPSLLNDDVELLNHRFSVFENSH